MGGKDRHKRTLFIFFSFFFESEMLFKFYTVSESNQIIVSIFTSNTVKKHKKSSPKFNLFSLYLNKTLHSCFFLLFLSISLDN